MNWIELLLIRSLNFKMVAIEGIYEFDSAAYLTMNLYYSQGTQVHQYDSGDDNLAAACSTRYENTRPVSL